MENIEKQIAELQSKLSELRKLRRKEYVTEYHRKRYLEKNPNAKKYEHKTEEEKKEYHRAAQKKHYKEYAETIKEKRKKRYNEREILKLIRNNKEIFFNGMFYYRITDKSLKNHKKVLKNYDIITINNKKYIGGF